MKYDQILVFTIFMFVFENINSIQSDNIDILILKQWKLIRKLCLCNIIFIILNINNSSMCSDNYNLHCSFYEIEIIDNNWKGDLILILELNIKLNVYKNFINMYKWIYFNIFI